MFVKNPVSRGASECKLELGVEEVDVVARAGVVDESAGEESTVADEQGEVSVEFVESGDVEFGAHGFHQENAVIPASLASTSKAGNVRQILRIPSAPRMRASVPTVGFRLLANRLFSPAATAQPASKDLPVGFAECRRS